MHPMVLALVGGSASAVTFVATRLWFRRRHRLAVERFVAERPFRSNRKIWAAVGGEEPVRLLPSSEREERP